MTHLDDPAEVLHRNLLHVFNQRDAIMRREAISEIYLEDAELHDPEGTFRGQEEISAAVGRLLDSMPGITFAILRPASFLNGVGRLQWSAAPASGPVVATGLDVAMFEGSKIKALYVFLDQPPD